MEILVATIGANPDLLDWLIAVLQMKKDVVAQGLWVGLGASTLYFLVMLLTSWGDRHTLFKALVFSGLIHLVSMVGWVAVVPSPVRSAELAPPEKEKPTPLELEIFSEDPQEIPQEGNTPIWNKLPDPVETQMARNDPKNIEPTPLEDPDREIAPPPEETKPDLPDLPPKMPYEQPDVPQPQEAREASAPQSPADVAMDQPETIAVPNLKAPPTVRERNPVPERGPFETTVDRAPQQGAADEVKREIDPNREFASIAEADDPSAYIKRNTPGDVIKKRTSPVPAFAPTPELGDPQNASDQKMPAGQNTPRRPTRLVNRETEDRINPNIKRTRTDRVPTPFDPARTAKWGRLLRKPPPTCWPTARFRCPSARRFRRLALAAGWRCLPLIATADRSNAGRRPSNSAAAKLRSGLSKKH